MLELDISPLGPLGDLGQADLERWASSGRSPASFENLLRAVLRAQLMRAAIAGSFGGSVEDGLSGHEASAVLALAAHRPVDVAQSAAKRLALRASADPSDLVGAMVQAALAQDARRLVERRRPAVGSQGRARALPHAPRTINGRVVDG